MCVIVTNMLFLSTNIILHFRKRISLIKMLYFRRIWRITLFLYLYQIYIIQFWTSKRPCVRKVIQTIELHYVGRTKSWIYTFFRAFNFITTHGNRQFRYRTLILCNKNAVYRGITQTLLLEAFSDLTDGLSVNEAKIYSEIGRANRCWSVRKARVRTTPRKEQQQKQSAIKSNSKTVRLNVQKYSIQPGIQLLLVRIFKNIEYRPVWG